MDLQQPQQPTTISIKQELPYSPKEPSSSKEELRPRICVICGDATNTYHYDIASCYGCKTFFRRAIIGKRKYVCNKGGNCQITKDTRCICRACRLRKCLENGMNPNAVGIIPLANGKSPMPESYLVKQEPMEVAYESNPETRQNSEEPELIRPVPVRLDGTSSTNPSRPLSSVIDEMTQTIQNLLYIEDKHEHLRKSNFSPFDPQANLNQMLQIPTSFADANKYALVQQWPQYTLNENQLTAEQLKASGLKAWFFVDLLLSVDYIKTFSLFRDLPLHDQYNLCYDVVVSSTHLTRSYYAYAQGAEIIMYPDGSYPFYARANQISPIESILRSGKVRDFARIRPDRIQYCLMRAISSFNTVSELITKDSYRQIERERNRYAKILLRYLQDKYGVDEGTKKFADSIAVIIEFIKMKKDYTESYHSCNYCLNHAGDHNHERPDPRLFCDLIHG